MVNKKTELVTRFGRGTLLGMGTDQLMYVVAGIFPQLQRKTPIKLPFLGYDKEGVHLDDLIALGVSTAVVGYGFMNKNNNTIVEGVGMLLGNILSSKAQVVSPPNIFKPSTPASVSMATTKGNMLIRVDV